MDQAVDFLTEDFSAEVTEKIPLHVNPVKEDKSKLQGALEQLLLLEKKTRLAADQKSTSLLATAIVDLCKDCGEWEVLMDHITMLCKRRAQLKKVVQGIVQQAVLFIEDTPDEKTKLSLIETLRTVSAGKMYVELELARLTRTLAGMKEAKGDVAGAADILQEVSVETIGSMEAREKLDFILDQMRLCLAKKDFIRAEIVSRKITSKQIAIDDLQDLRLKYYEQMITLHTHKAAYLDICKCYDAIYHTKLVKDDNEKSTAALSKAVVFVSLSPFDAEVADLLARFKADPKLEEMAAYRRVLVDLTTDELVAWPLASAEAYQTHTEFTGPNAEKLMADLQKNVVQHNIRVCSKYYKRITSARLATLLQLSTDAMEQAVSDMVSDGQLFAKIDRCVGTVTFQKPLSPPTVLNGWVDDISKMLNLVDKTCHLINKENMTHGISA